MAEFTSSRKASSSAGGAKFGNRDSTLDAGICKASSSKAQMNPDQGPSQAKHESEVQIADDEAVSRQEKNGVQPDTENIGYKAMDKLKQRVYDVVSYKKNIRLLQTRIQSLTEAIAEVEPLLSSGGNDPEDEVHEWFAKASDILKDSNGILLGRSNIAGRKRICSTCLDPTPSWETGELLREVERVMQDKENLDLESYSCGMFYCNNLQSRENQLQEILKVLNGMIDADGMVSVTGMIGVGKTVLAREFARRAQDNQLFDYTVMVQVSESVDVKSMQSQISKRIGLKLSENDDEETSACRLSTALEQKTRRKVNKESGEQSKILVIIDGLQHAIDLEKVGITVKSTQKREVVLLSRNPKICKSMGAEKFFLVKCLDLKESKVLLRESLKGKMQSMEITRGKYRYLENVMVMKCGGLPLIINSLACVLRSMSWYNWEILADKLLRHSFLEIDEVKEVTSPILELCNNFVRKGDIQNRFLLCCLILGQKGEDVPLEKLKRYGAGFSLFANDPLAIFDDWVHELKTLSFLLETEPQHVKIHDIIHIAGVSAMSQGDNNLLIVLDDGISSHTREAYENCVAISTFSDSMSKSLDGLELNKLQAFRLKDEPSSRAWCREDMTNLCIPDNFFQVMTTLKILEISCRRIIKVPSSFQALKNLITLHLEKCDIEGEIMSTICELDKLKVLSLLESSIEVIPEEIEKLANLRVLDLTGCRGLRIFPLDSVAKIVPLQELYLDDERWASNTNDLKNLSSTSDGMYSNSSSFANLRRFRICVGYQDIGLEDMSHFSKVLLIKDCTVSDLVKRSLRGLLPRTDFLQINQLKGSCNSISEFCKDVFSHLKMLHIVRCKVVCISEESRDIFPELQVLTLEDLPDLTSICWWEEVGHYSFPQLKELRLEKLGTLAPYALPAQIAGRLRFVQVSRCSNLRYIFQTEVNGDMDGPDLCLEFPNMEVLKLQTLPNLLALIQPLEDSAVGDERPFLFNVKVKLPLLKIIRLEGLEQIENLWDLSGSQQISQPRGRSPQFGNLKSITISLCYNLKSLFPSTIVNSLLQLETLRVEYCGKLGEIITSISSDADDDAGTTAAIAFPRLKALKLVRLINLQCFSRGPSLLNFPMLKELELRFLPQMNAFTLPVLECRQADLQKLSEESRPFLFSDNLTNVNLPSLETMSLQIVGEMTDIWDLSAGSRKFAAHILPQISQSSVNSPLFGNLKNLTVSNCTHMESLFPCRIVNSLLQLETLEVHTCNSMKEVITNSTNDAEDTTTSTTFPRLKVLRVYNMDILECFSRGLRVLKMPILKELILSDLRKMKAFTLPSTQSIARFFHGEIDLSSLEHLEVECMGIEFLEYSADKLLFSLKKLKLDNLCRLKMIRWNMLPNLQTLIITDLPRHWTSLMSFNLLAGGGVFTRLEYMIIQDCMSMKTIISGVELGQDFFKSGITLLPSLKKIVLVELPRLETFTTGRFDVHFPSLETVRILQCDFIRSFSMGRLTTPMLKSVEWDGKPLLVEEYDELNVVLEKGMCWVPISSISSTHSVEDGPLGEKPIL